MRKLTNNDAVEIRCALELGMTNRELARLYGVSDTTISQIKSGTRHKSDVRIRKPCSTRRSGTVSQKKVWLSIDEAEALLCHLDACQYWMSNNSLECENEELALMLQNRIDGRLFSSG